MEIHTFPHQVSLCTSGRLREEVLTQLFVCKQALYMRPLDTSSSVDLHTPSSVDLDTSSSVDLDTSSSVHLAL